MRSALVFAFAVAFILLSLSRASHAEPPPPMETRDVKAVLEAIKKQQPKLRAQLASVRWYVEVEEGTSVQAPVGSPLTTLGAWSADGAPLAWESACQPLEAPRKKAALALLAEFGEALPTKMRGVALLEQGKADEAAAIFTRIIEGALPAKGCPSEHPMYSHQRVTSISLALKCVERAAPKKDRAKLEELLRRAESCAANNHAVG